MTAAATTIVALASASGRAGVAVLRISGPEAKDILIKIGKPAVLPKPRVAVLRDLYDCRTGLLLDHALVLDAVYLHREHILLTP